MTSRTYESRMHAAVKAGDWDAARQLYDERFRSKWSWNDMANLWTSRDGTGRTLSVAQEKESHQRLENWIQTKIAEHGSRIGTTQEDEEPLERKRGPPRTLSAFQDTASLIASGRTATSARNAFVPSAVLTSQAIVSLHSKTAEEHLNHEPKAESVTTLENDEKKSSVDASILGGGGTMDETETTARQPPIQEAEVSPEEIACVEDEKNSTETSDHETNIMADAASHGVVANESVVEDENKNDDEVAKIESSKTESVALPESLAVAGESAFVGKRIVSTFNPEALPTAGEIDALQALQYPVYKVQPAQWAKLASTGSMVLVDPCMRPNTTFLLMRHSKSNSMVRVYPDGKPATNAMDWREICAVFEDLYPSSSLDLDQLTKVIRKRPGKRSSARE